jgi:hypothetical protein
MENVNNPLTMKQIIGMVVLALLLCVAVVAAYFASGKTLQMRITQQEIEDGIQQAFPMTRGVVKLDLAEAQAKCLSEQNRLVVSGNIKISVLGMINGSGFCQVSGEPQFNPVTHAIQFKEVRIEQLTLDGVPEKMRDQVVQLADKAVLTFLREYPFYQFNQEKWTQRFIGNHVRAVKVNDDGLVLTLGW